MNNEQESMDETNISQAPTASELKAQKKEDEIEASAKATKVVGKAVASYYGGPMAGKAVDYAANTAIGKRILRYSGKQLRKQPGLGNQLDKLNKSGAIDEADKAVDTIGGSGGAASKGASGASSSMGKTSAGVSQLGSSQPKNMQSGSSLGADSSGESPQDTSNGGFSMMTSGSSSKLSDSIGKSGKTNGTMDKKKLLIELIKKYPAAIGIIAIIALFIIFICISLLVVVAYAGEENYNDSSSNSIVNGISSPITTAVATQTTSCPQLTKPIDDYLKEKSSSLSEFNQYIVNEVHKAGVGTRQGVVAAALAATSGLCQNFNIRLPYTMGGAHPSNFYGISSLWGSSINGGKGEKRFGYGPYYYEGPDCSGFVGWSIYNGGYKFSSMLAKDFGTLGTTHATGNYEGQPGDILYNSHHVVMIVGSSGSNYLIAEASSGENGTRAVQIPKNTSSYTVVDMTSFYNNESNKNVESYPQASATSIDNNGDTDNGSSSNNNSSAKNGKIVVLDPGHGKSSINMSASEKTSAGFSQKNGSWGEWRYFKKGTWGEECKGTSDCPTEKQWYPIENGDRNIEPEITLEYAKAAKKYLEQKGYTVRMTRTSNNENPSFNNRAVYAFNNKNSSNPPDAVAIICLHSNAGGGRGSAYISLNGGTYYQKYIPSDYIDKSNSLGKAINDEIVNQTSLSAYGSGVINNENYLILFHKSPVPVAYLEVGFFDNSTELATIKSEYDKIGKAIADGFEKWNN